MAASSKHSPAFPLLNLKGDFFKELPYNQGSVIAKGMSGDVVLVTCSDKPNEKRVLKRMPLKCRRSERAAKMLFMYELDTFYRTDHRGLATCILAARCPGYLAIVMKFYPLGDLERSLSILPLESRPWVAARVSEAVDYLHTKRIVHGDIKLQNILLDTGFTPVLSDFGLSRYLTEDVLTLSANKNTGLRRFETETPLCKSILSRLVLLHFILLNFVLFCNLTPKSNNTDWFINTASM